jgi:3-hydroxybutyryl-CoA dehydratase
VSSVDWSATYGKLELGLTFRTRGRTITETDLVSFAALTGDRHPQHTDSTWAASGQFGERIAHGMLLVSYAVGLVPFDPDRLVALRRIQDVVFKRPAKIGDTINVEGRIEQLTPISDRAGLVRWKWDVRDASQLLLCRATVEVLWATGTGPAESPAEPHLAELLGIPHGVIPC